MARLITPLTSNVPIVDKQGNPTPYFSRILEEISDAKISASVIDAMGGDPGGDRVVVWDDATGDLAFMTTSEVLDFITGASHGDILFRGSAGWETLDAGNAGQLLQTNGTGADPEWVDPPSGGGLVLLGTATGGGTTLTVNSISGAYTDLVFSASMRTGGTNYQIIARLNNDSAAIYDTYRQYGGGTTGGDQQVSQTSFTRLTTTSGIASSGYFVTVVGTIPFYANTAMWKTIHTQATQADAAFTTGGFIVNNSGKWRSTAAVTRLDLITSTGAGTFDSDSVLKVWGRV